MAAPGENLKVNGDRLWDSLMEMAKIGPGVAGGNNRQTLTDADGEGRDLRSRTVEGCHRDLEAFAFLAEPLGDRHPHVVEMHERRIARALPHLVFLASWR